MERQLEYVMRTVEERGVRFVRLWFTDVQGFLKSFAITPAELEVALEQGMAFDGSAIAPSQQEIDLRYTDALSMADNVMTFRLVVKEVAQEQGAYATFMPKPLAGVNGSGMHTHLSLFEGDVNAFHDAGDEHGLSPVAK